MNKSRQEENVTVWSLSKLWTHVSGPSLPQPSAKIVIKTTHTHTQDGQTLCCLTAFHWPWGGTAAPTSVSQPHDRPGCLHPDPADHTDHLQLVWTIRLPQLLPSSPRANPWASALSPNELLSLAAAGVPGHSWERRAQVIVYALWKLTGNRCFSPNSDIARKGFAEQSLGGSARRGGGGGLHKLLLLQSSFLFFFSKT